MFKKKLLSLACLSAGLTFGAGSALALPYLQVNDGDPTEREYVQLLEDDFYEVIITGNLQDGYTLKPVDADTVIVEGDIFAGVQRVQGTETVNPTGGIESLQESETFTQIFLIETLTSSTPEGPYPDGGENTQTFTSVDAEVWEAIFGETGLLDICQPTSAGGACTGFDITDLDGAGAEVSDGTMTMLFWGALFPDTETDDLLVDLGESATTFIQDAALQYEFGLTCEDEGGAVEACAGQFWTTTGENSAYPFYSAQTDPTVKIALDITKQWSEQDLEKHVYRNLTDTDFTAATHLQAIGGVANVANDTPWGVFGDIDAYIRPVPAPAPLALMAAGLLGLSLSQRRKKSA